MEWYQAVIVFAVAFAVAYCMVPVSKKIAFRIGAIDYPGYRRMNREPIPRCGGIALYVGLIVMISADKSVEPSSTAMTRMLSLNMVWL